MPRLHALLAAMAAASALLAHGTGDGVRPLRSPVGLVLEGPEPNGSPGSGGTPTLATCGDQCDGVIQTGGDQDWWQFTLTQGVLLQAVTSPGLSVFGMPSPIGNTVLEIRDATFALVATNDDYMLQYTSAIARGSYSFCEVELAPGTYYAVVRAFTATQTGAYTLDLRCAAPGYVVTEWPEPNASPFLGEMPTPIGLGQQGDGEVVTQGDHDWWVFAVPATTALIVETGPSLQRAGAIGDPVLEIHDATGLSIATNDDGGVGAYSQILITLQAGTYYANVGGFGTLTGTYRILFYVAPQPAAPIAEGAEPNGDPRSSGVPTPIACDQFGAGEIVGAGGPAPAGDADWWTFTVANPGWVVVYTLGDSNPAYTGAVGDTEVWIYNSSFAQVGYDDDGGVGLFSEASAWLNPGTYFVNVEGFGAPNVGRYFLKIECAGGLPGFARLSGGCRGSNGNTPTVTVRNFEQALTGTTFVTDFVRLPANAPLAPLIGFSNTMTSGGIPLPFSLAGLGAPGCQLAVDPLVSLSALATSFGTYSFALSVPSTASLAGLVLYTQVLTIDPPANTFGLTSSDAGAMILGSRF